MPEAGLPSADMFRFYDKNGKEIPRWGTIRTAAR